MTKIYDPLPQIFTIEKEEIEFVNQIYHIHFLLPYYIFHIQIFKYIQKLHCPRCNPILLFHKWKSKKDNFFKSLNTLISM